MYFVFIIFFLFYMMGKMVVICQVDLGGNIVSCVLHVPRPKCTNGDLPVNFCWGCGGVQSRRLSSVPGLLRES